MALGSPLIEGNLIVGNHAEGYGGGIFVGYQAEPIIRGNVLSENFAAGGGDGEGGGLDD